MTDLAMRKRALEATLATAREDRGKAAYAVEFEDASPTLLDDAMNAERAAEARLESFDIAESVQAQKAKEREAKDRFDSHSAAHARAAELIEDAAKAYGDAADAFNMAFYKFDLGMTLARKAQAEVRPFLPNLRRGDDPEDRNFAITQWDKGILERGLLKCAINSGLGLAYDPGVIRFTQDSITGGFETIIATARRTLGRVSAESCTPVVEEEADA